MTPSRDHRAYDRRLWPWLEFPLMRRINPLVTISFIAVGMSAAEPAVATPFRMLNLPEPEQVKKGPMYAETTVRHTDQGWPAAKPEAIEV
jgi:hypothetical protein